MQLDTRAEIYVARAMLDIPSAGWPGKEILERAESYAERESRSISAAREPARTLIKTAVAEGVLTLETQFAAGSGRLYHLSPAGRDVLLEELESAKKRLGIR